MSHLSFPIDNFLSESIYTIAATEAAEDAAEEAAALLVSIQADTIAAQATADAAAAAAAVAAGSWGDIKSATVVAGVLTLTGHGYYKVDGANASNNVDTINGLSEGDEVVLTQADLIHVLVFRHGVDNLSFLGGINITLNALIEKVRLISNGTTITEASSRP